MPVVHFRKEDIYELLGRRLDDNDLARCIAMLGADLEQIDEEIVSIEFNPNRPDMYSVEGFVRALKGYLGIEKGLPSFEISHSSVYVEVDPSVRDVRPYIVCGLIRGVELDDDLIADLMNFQEDLHWAIGRNRKRASIGLHDFDKVKPPFFYKAVDLDGVRFVPLGMEREMTPREILREHEKGREYAHLIKDRAPLIVDSEGNVLSMPPIINGIITAVTSETRNIFIDVTGPDFRAINYCLNIISTALAERGGRIETVEIRYEDKTLITPNLAPRRKRLRISYANKLIGLSLSPEEMIECLRRMRLDARIVGEDELEVLIPPYRVDIMHEVDLVEEVAIGYGYDRLEPAFPRTATIGKHDYQEEIISKIRRVMTSLGFLEVITFILTNELNNFEKMRLEVGERVIIENPITEDQTMVRTWLLPSLLSILGINKHRDLPQRLFEIGDVVVLDESFETGARNEKKLCFVVEDTRANFSQAKSYLEALMLEMGLDFDIEEREHPSFIEGRSAAVVIDGRDVGILGEVHPEVLLNFDIEYPTVACELNLTSLIEIKRSKIEERRKA